MKRLIPIILILFLVSLLLVRASEKTVVYFFYSKNCPHCAAEKTFLDQLESKYPDIEIKRLDVDEENNSELYIKMNKAYGTTPQGVPMTFIGENFVLGYGNYETSGRLIEEAIISCIENGCIDPIEKLGIENGEEEKEISMVQLMGLAAVDAINPCELAVLVILMTAILTRFPTEKRKALKSGLAFSAAIFIIYFMFGILIISGFKFIANFAIISESWIYQALAVLSIILGLLNIKDAIWYGGGGFIMEVPKSWRPKMKKIIHETTSVLGAFITGLIVSFFLTPCTGGPYFVAGGLLSAISLIEAIPYLFLYMCIFISPMIAITLIVYFGFMAVEDISGWREKNIKRLHWVAGLLLLGLGISMLLGLI
jgi:cytochrome c biogenesis protein CcdA/glutaredoxin